VTDADEDRLLRAVALRNAEAILLARQRAEGELLKARDALEGKTAALDHSLAIMRATLEATTDAILVTDVERRVIDFNANYARMWQLQPNARVAERSHPGLAEVVGRNVADRERFAARLEAIYAADEAEAFDELRLLDGRIIERYSRIQYIQQRNVGRVWSFRDVTEQRHAEQALLEETRVLDLINRAGTAIAATLDLQTLLQTVTDAATELSGARFGAFFYNTVDERGKAFRLYTLAGAPREAFERFGSPRATALFGPIFNGEGSVRIDDVLRDARYGRMAPHHGLPPGHPPVRSFMAVAVVSPSGEPIGGLFFGHPEPGVFSERDERMVRSIAAQAAIAVDNARLYDEAKSVAAQRAQLVDAERAARAESERLGRMKDEFLATLSHELRTPLTAILGWARVLQLKADDADSVARGVDAIARNARAQAQLIDDLLDMNRIVSGKVRLDVQPTDLATVIDAAIESVRPSLDAKELHLRKRLDALAGPVQGDPHRLQQVVWNLLTNAVKFTPRGGRIEVRLECVAANLELSVHDSGLGIAPDFLPHVFDRFRQADASTTRDHGGLGLGLSIVKQLIELHGGTVRAESAGEGQGAAFIVILPPAPLPAHGERREHPASLSIEPTLAEKVSLAGIKVLVVDDQADTCELIRRVLTQAGAQVVVAGSAAEGMLRIEADRPDVMVSDIGMPQTDGYQFMRDVRRLPASRGGRTPAVALTAFARSEDRTRAMMAGYHVHIAKPIEPMELVATVGNLIDRTSAA
jgi:signal transduction histidine kinase/CheY-like chemotaxis protein